MPITSIWPIKGNYVKALDYIKNPEKTKDKDKSVISELEDVLSYVSNGEKTNQKYYVTGINCNPDNAAQEFAETKIGWDKTNGVQAFHAIQSFKPGEIDAALTHQIGVELAKQMWGDRFEVVVCTHLDKDHPHNHFVVNSVSDIDGKKFDNNRKDYERFSSLSDSLARQYGLSVIEERSGKGRHYAEWKADQEYKPTIRSSIKEDIDYVISSSESFKEFEINLRKMGYEIKHGKHLAVRAPGGQRFIRLYKLSNTDDYSEEAIRERILENSLVHFEPFYSPDIPTTVAFGGKTKETKKLKGFHALYVKYMFRMGILPQHAPRNPKVHFIFKQDLNYLDAITAQVTYLFKHEITDKESLDSHKEQLQLMKVNLEKRSHALYNRIQRSQNAAEIDDYEVKRDHVMQELKEIRKEIRLCDEIENRVQVMDQKINEEERKEIEDESRRRHSRSNGKDDPRGN